AQAPGWLAGFAAFLTGDLLTGAGVEKALVLNIANMISISVAYAILTRVPPEIREMRQPVSMLWIVLASLAGGFASGLLGGYVGPRYWGGDVLSGIVYWTAGEFVTFIAFLPVILSAPPLGQIRKYWYRLDLI